MGADISKYLGRITAQHRDKPLFIAAVTAIVQPLADLGDTIRSLPAKFDLDTAEGEQLDYVGQWIGLTRYVNIPTTGVYFTFDTPGQGWDAGIWFGPGASGSDTTRLGDQQYRLLLQARALNNAWDGSIPQAYELYDTLFAAFGRGLLIHDHGDLTMALELTGDPVDPITAALFEGGYLDVRPAGVEITSYILP